MLKKQIVQFIFIGVVNTLFYYSLYSFFIFMEIDYKLAVLFATSIGVFFSFKMFGKFVFDNNDNRLIFKFLIIYLILYILNILLIDLFNDILKNYYSSGFIATLISAVVSFILNKFFVFKGE